MVMVLLGRLISACSSATGGDAAADERSCPRGKGIAGKAELVVRCAAVSPSVHDPTDAGGQCPAYGLGRVISAGWAFNSSACAEGSLQFVSHTAHSRGLRSCVAQAMALWSRPGVAAECSYG